MPKERKSVLIKFEKISSEWVVYTNSSYMKNTFMAVHQEEGNTIDVQRRAIAVYNGYVDAGYKPRKKF